MGYARFEKVAGLIVVTVVIVIIASTVLEIEITNTVLAVSSLLLSALLVIIYSRQSEIMNRQVELMSLEQEPVLVYDRYEPDGDGVQVWVSNSGKGTATNLRLHLEIKLPDGKLLTTPSDNSPLNRKEDEVWQSNSPIHHNQTEIEYYGIPVVGIEDENGVSRVRRFRQATEILLSKGLEDIKFRLSIKYSSKIGGEHELQLRSLNEVELREPLVLEDAIKASRKHPYEHSKWEYAGKRDT